MLSDCDQVDSLWEYLDVNPEEIFEAQGSAPHYEVDETGASSLFVEGVCVAPALELGKADLLLLWAATFPVLNQKCPKSKAKNALIFITQSVFDKAGSTTMCNRVLGRVQKLKQLCA